MMLQTGSWSVDGDDIEEREVKQLMAEHLTSSSTSKAGQELMGG